MPQFTPAQKEQIARQNGFRNYDEMILWQRQRQQPSGGVVIKGSSAAQPGDWGPNTRPSVQAATSWHPANIFNYITEALRGATGR